MRNPSEFIYFSLLAFIIVVIIGLIQFVFRTQKKWTILLTSVLVIGFLVYYVSYPTLKKYTHAVQYEKMTEYLEQNYPTKQFHIEPQQYEKGYHVGEFNVNDIQLPTIGVTLQVKKDGQVTQIGTWSKNDYPTRQSLWEEIAFIYTNPYTLNKEIPQLSILDEWTAGELVVFVVTIDEILALAAFHYSAESYALLELKSMEMDDFIFIEVEDYIFSYIDENYEGEKITFTLQNDEQYTVNVTDKKGRLIVERH